MTDRLKFEHRQPNANWQDSISNILLPIEIAAQASESHAQSILNVVVGMSTAKPLAEYEIDALIHQALAIKNQMLDVQEMIEIAGSGNSSKKVASGGAS